jgi:hypothetical protein
MQNCYAERVIGSIRRECLNHVIVMNEWHLRRILKSYIGYYNRSRTYLSLDKDAPESRPVHDLQAGSSNSGSGRIAPSVRAFGCLTADEFIRSLKTRILAKDNFDD